jgi:quercetin dioxygenase-like cupin family protein
VVTPEPAFERTFAGQAFPTCSIPVSVSSSIKYHQFSQHHAMSAIEINVGQLGIRYLIDGSHSASMGMFELTVPPGSNVPPPHSHSNNEELVYVLEGTLRYTVGADTRDLTAGQGMHTPRGTVHAFSNPSDSLARALIILSPDIGAQYFQDIAAVANAGDPPDKAALVAVMRRYGLVPSAPK